MYRFLLPLLLICSLAFPASARQSEMFDQSELHHSVANTTFLAPKIAATYGITRDKEKAILNLAMREGEAIYSIAKFKFLNEEWRHFEVHFRPESAGKTYTFKLKHQMYSD